MRNRYRNSLFLSSLEHTRVTDSTIIVFKPYLTEFLCVYGIVFDCNYQRYSTLVIRY